jgi:hypothetical protein
MKFCEVYLIALQTVGLILICQGFFGLAPNQWPHRSAALFSETSPFRHPLAAESKTFE